MNTSLDQELRVYHRQFGNDHSELRADLGARLAGLAPQPTPPAMRRLKWRGVSLGATAALLLIALSVWLLSPRDLYAKVLDSLKSASTIYLHGTRYDTEGRIVGRAEVWYDRQRGVREEIEENGRKEIRLDDGKRQWDLVVGAPFATRSKSSDPLGLVRGALVPEKAVRRAVRLPEQDAEIDGAPCQCYQSEGPDRASRYRTWIDSQFHARCFVKEIRRGNAWIRLSVVQAHYDVPIDAQRFAPDFIQGVKVMASEDADKRFDLQIALARKEVMGNVLAVHELQRISDRLLFLVYSVRPSEETVKRFGNKKNYEDFGSANYGDFQPTYWQRINDKRELSTQEWPLGSFTSRNGNLQIGWSLMILRGAWQVPLKKFDVTGYVHTRNELARALEQSGTPWYHLYCDNEPLMTLPFPDRTYSLEEATARTYEDLSRLMASKGASVWLQYGYRPLSEKEIQEMVRSGTVAEHTARRMSQPLSSTPERMSLEEYQAAVKAAIEKCLPP
jgi:hypothetical protein